jgi:hypothetical protein
MIPTKQQVKYKMLSNIKEGREANVSNQRHMVKKIRSDLNSYYNSVNVLTGCQGKGKTFTALTEIITISYLPETHIIIYVKKKDYDETFEAIRELSNVPIIDVQYDQAEQTVKRIFECKSYYNRLRREAVNHNVDPEDIPEHIKDPEAVNELLEGLRIDDFKRSWLNTIILFDDGGNSGLFSHKDGYFNNIFKILRDVNAIIYITIHGMTQLTSSIKENLAVVYIGKGLSRDRLRVVHFQTNNSLEWSDFVKYYDMMNRDPQYHLMVVDVIDGKITAE